LDVPREEWSALDEWCNEWLGSGTDVINQSLVDALPPGFNLPRGSTSAVGKLKPFQNRHGSALQTTLLWQKVHKLKSPDYGVTMIIITLKIIG